MFRLSSRSNSCLGWIGCTALLMAAPVLAQSGAAADSRARKEALRQAADGAYHACTELAQHDACTIGRGDQRIEGECTPDPEDGSLFCRPKQPPLPPTAAYDACESKDVGDSCRLEAAAGSCVAARGFRLVCEPARPPP